MHAFAIVFVGAGIGGVIRQGVNLIATKLLGFDPPWGTFVINVIGSFLMGLLAGWLAFKASEAWTQPLRLFLATGVLGGFTTFSSFSLDAALLWERGSPVTAGVYVLASVGVGILGLALGLALVRSMT